MAKRNAAAASPSRRSVGEGDVGRLVESVEIRGVHLLSSSSQLESIVLNDSSGPQLEVHVHPTQYRYQIQPGGKVLVCGIKCGLEIRPEGGSRAPFVSIGAEYVIVYDVGAPESCTPEAAKEFASRNAVFNCWPFFREFAQSLACRMGIAPVVVPLLKLSPPSPKRAKL